jgi:hypothetical protein
MSFGFSATGSTGGFIIDSDYQGYFVDSANPTYLGAGPLAGGFHNWPLPGLNGRDLLFARPASATVGNTAICAFSVSPSVRDFWVPQDIYYYTLKCYNGHTSPSGSFGMEIFDESGGKVFNSQADACRMRIVAQGTINITSVVNSQVIASGSGALGLYCMINSTTYGLTFPVEANQGFYYVYDFASNTVSARWGGGVAQVSGKFHYMLVSFDS